MTDEKIKEAKSLRWLAVQFPKVENPKDDVDRMQNCINLYCTNAANFINRQQAEIEAITEKFNCQQTVYADLSKIIKDKNAEIEQYKARVLNDTEYLERLEVENRKQQAEIERLSHSAKSWEHTAKDLFIGKQTVRDEAIKEFAERLKEECAFECDVSLGYGRPCYEDAIPIIAIDNLVKEMVGEDK